MTQRAPSAYINIGGGIRFLSADYYVRELAPLGMTMRGFRAWCKCLGVPMIRIGKTWVVEMFAFHTAMRAISQVGQPDFLAPGCDIKASGRIPKDAVCKLDPDYYHENFEIIIGEILACRAANGLPSPKATVKAAREAAKRMVLMGIQGLPTHRERKISRARFRKKLADMEVPKTAKVALDG